MPFNVKTDKQIKKSLKVRCVGLEKHGNDSETNNTDDVCWYVDYEDPSSEIDWSHHTV